MSTRIMTTVSNKRYFLSMVSFMLLLLSLGCTTQKSTSVSPSGLPDKLTRLTASYASRPINVPAIVALEKQNFEQDFKKEGIEFKWVEIAAGPAQLEALASKSIDISTSMNYVSALMGKANGNDIKVVAGYSRFPGGIGLVTRAELEAKNLADVKNKKIALQKGTMLHEFLIRALEKENLQAGDIEIIAMDSADAATAILAGQVDAAILPEPLLSKVLSSKKAELVLTAEKFISAQTLIVARSDFAKSHPDAIRRFVALHDQNIQWAENNKASFYLIASKQLNLEEKVIATLYPKFIFKTKLDATVIDELKISAQFLQQNGFIKPNVNTGQLVTDLVDLES